MGDLGAWLGLALSEEQHDLLERYGRWLVTEARAVGGIGPNEGPRVFDRHVGDALMYHTGFMATVTAAIDVGSGVGLPGIPLAIARPDVAFTLVDRSERRIDLARRAVRILRLENVAVVHADIADVESRFDLALFRASLTIEAIYAAVPGLVAPGGEALVGLSRLREAPRYPSAAPSLDTEMTCHEPPMLDSPFWFLRMRPTSSSS